MKIKSLIFIFLYITALTVYSGSMQFKNLMPGFSCIKETNNTLGKPLKVSGNGLNEYIIKYGAGTILGKAEFFNGILDYLDLDFYNSGIQSGFSKVQVLKSFNLAGCNFYIGKNSNYTFYYQNNPYYLAIKTDGKKVTDNVTNIIYLSPRQYWIAKAKKEGVKPGLFPGFNCKNLTEKELKIRKLSENGLLITNVIKDSSADKAGIKKNDIILTVNNKKFINFETFYAYLNTLNPESKVSLLLISENRNIKSISLRSRSDYTYTASQYYYRKSLKYAKEKKKVSAYFYIEVALMILPDFEQYIKLKEKYDGRGWDKVPELEAYG